MNLNDLINSLDCIPEDQLDPEVACNDCEWQGLLSDCPIEIEQDTWEMPEYQVPICPKCGEVIEI